MINSKRKPLSIGIICGFPFPIGYSGTNRVVSIARGLHSNGQNIKVFLYKPTELHDNVINKEYKGTYKGVSFIYPGATTIKHKTKPGKLSDLILGIILLFKNLYKVKDKLDVVLIDTDLPHILCIFTLFLRVFLKVRIYVMVDEYPKEIRRGKKEITKKTKWLYKKSFKRLNGLISMTKPLEEFYSKYFLNKNSIIIPMTVETDRFQMICKSDSNAIAYVGNFDIKKDGVDILIQAFTKVLKFHPELKLSLAGEGKIADMRKVHELIDSLNISNKVDLVGRLHRDEVPNFLANAKILAMARPSSLRNQGGFPTKLGEYLLAGKPVLVTDIGDISLSLKDGESIYLAKPDDVEDFAKKLKYIIENYKDALEVSAYGRKVAKSSFDFIIQTKRMVDFLHK